jgi:PTS system mannose-specific IIB component
MVGIVLASHGGFADGIFQSAEMIFGKQENLAHVILKPDEGPDDIRAKMEKAVASFDDQDQVLFLIDLWGGTPFNQANNLVKEHEDTWAIVSGMNLPMVIEALGQRMGSDNAHDIAKAIVKPGRDGIKTQPESLMPKETTAKSAS